jgi:hypothetical protein
MATLQEVLAGFKAWGQAWKNKATAKPPTAIRGFPYTLPFRIG